METHVNPGSATPARWRRRLATLLGGLGSVGGGLAALLLPATEAQAVDLPEDTAESMLHVYSGGGTRASGPALLVRKRVMDGLALSGNWYVDIVSNASIDVVTQASAYKETRHEYTLAADAAVRDTLIHVSTTHSTEPDYLAGSASLDLSQEVFGGMTTVSFGATRGNDTVKKKGSADFLDHAQHWQYRLGATQILSPRWLMSANLEAIADDGYLASPYRSARVFGAAVPERDPRTRSSRALKFRVLGDISREGDERTSVHADWRIFRDNWKISANTVELGLSRHLGDKALADVFVRWYGQTHALFYSDNASVETLYVSRNRQLADFHSLTLGGQVQYTLHKAPGQYELQLHGTLDLMQFKYADFTDIRTGLPYKNTASIVQVALTASF